MDRRTAEERSLALEAAFLSTLKRTYKEIQNNAHRPPAYLTDPLSDPIFRQLSDHLDSFSVQGSDGVYSSRAIPIGPGPR